MSLTSHTGKKGALVHLYFRNSLGAFTREFALNRANTVGIIRDIVGYLSFIPDRIKLDSLPTLGLAILQNCLNY